VKVEIIRESVEAKSMRGRRWGSRRRIEGDSYIGGGFRALSGGVRIGGADVFRGSNRWRGRFVELRMQQCRCVASNADTNG